MDLNNKTAIEIRLLMKDLGWISEDKLTNIGWNNKFGYSIWFKRWDWHGRNTLSLTGHHVCFHRSTDNLNEIDYITKICAKQCLMAYEEFTDCIPFQNAYNETKKYIMFYDWNDPKCILKDK